MQSGGCTRAESKKEQIPATSEEGLQQSTTRPPGFHTEQGSLDASQGVRVGTRTGSSASVCPGCAERWVLPLPPGPLQPLWQ